MLLSMIALAGFALAATLPETSLSERHVVAQTLRKGLGTRYGDGCTEENCWQDGACSFVDYQLPARVDGSTCVSEEIWRSGYQCGGCIAVSYKGRSMIVMVTNLTGGDKNHLDMTPATWSKLTGGLSAGGVDGIEWHFTPCPIEEPLQIKMHGGSSQYWFAATVENARRRTRAMYVSSNQGQSWQTTTRSRYNFFELDGTLPSSTVWVRVVSHIGTEVIIKDVELVSKKVTKASKNYE